MHYYLAVASDTQSFQQIVRFIPRHVSSCRIVFNFYNSNKKILNLNVVRTKRLKTRQLIMSKISLSLKVYCLTTF